MWQIKMYSENIYGIIEKTGEKVSTLVIPKNTGLKGYAWKVLGESGLNLDKAIEADKNKLTIDGLTLLLRRGEDIPQIVEDEFKKGNVVLGFTGDDLLDEYKLRNPANTLRIENTYDWFDESARFFRPTLCLIGKSEAIGDLPLEARIAINGKYEFTSRNYLRTEPLVRDKNFIPTIYSGDLESTVADGINDCCIDTVYSGASIGRNGLKIIQKIRFSDLAVISALKQDESLLGRAIMQEFAQMMQRLKNPNGSYTSNLLQDPEKITRKANEEMYELIQAFYGRGNPIGEAADVLYALTLMMASKRIIPDEIAREMLGRQK